MTKKLFKNMIEKKRKCLKIMKRCIKTWTQN